MPVDLRRVPLPDFGPSAEPPDEPPSIPVEEYRTRATDLAWAVGTDWVAVYGDREHSANLLFLSGFDPRFEEALLLLGPDDRRVLVVGNEGVIHAAVARLPVEVVLYQGFSLLGQPRDDAPRLDAVLRDVGLQPGERVGVAGWKFLEAAETDDPTVPAFVPAFVVDALRRVAGEDLVDATPALMHPVHGLRTRATAAQIAAFEWGAVRAGEAVLRVVRGTEPGMTERTAAGLMGYAGEPLSMHPIVASGARGEAINGLRSPSGRRIGAGDGVTCGVGYWGSLCCRAGLVTAEPEEAFLDSIVRPYYAAIAAWYATIRVGVPGGEVSAAVDRALADAGAAFRPLLNPGHLISYDEWVHSPIRPGSTDPLASGMMLQCDIIPAPLPAGVALNCEDSVVLADAALRQEIARDHPDLWDRVQTRRAFMRDGLGLTLSPDLLPLSPANAYLPPFWLDDQLVCVVAG